MLWVHKVTESSTLACALFILTALGFSKVSHRRVLGHDHTATVVASVHAFHSCLSLLLISKFDIDVANHVVSNVVSHNHLVHLAKLSHLHKDFFVEGLEVLDCLHEVLFGHITAVGVCNGCIWILIHMLEAHSLTERWLIMHTSACVSMAASTDLEVERTVYSVKKKGFVRNF